MKILLIEDEAELVEIIKRHLSQESYTVESAASYITAAEKVELYEYDCILLDIMLPDGNGLDILRKIKEKDNTMQHGGVIIISAKGSIDDKVDGLELGADDYLPKPFHLAELSARIKSTIRRSRQGGNSTVDIGNVAISTSSRTVSVSGNELQLSRKEYDILLYFVQRAGHIINKESLAEGVWGDFIDQSDNFDFIYAQLKNLRRKLTSAKASVEIKTIYGFGYKMVEL